MNFLLAHRKYFLIRRRDATTFLENLLISSLATIIAIRVFLHLTGYPQLGGRGLHIAHMLYGGILMLAVIVILLAFIDDRLVIASSIIGGVGWGIFIDELGKFITSDNNYFFQPTIALIYVISIILFLIFRAIERDIKPSEKEYLIQAMNIYRQSIISGIDRIQRNRALELLKNYSPSTPFVETLKKGLKEVDLIETKSPNFVYKAITTLNIKFTELIKKKWFYTTLITVATLAALVDLISRHIAVIERGIDLQASNFIEVGGNISTVASGILVVIGIFYIHKSILTTFTLFRHSVLISIFFTQFFRFYQDQLPALVWLIINIILLMTLNQMISLSKTEKYMRTLTTPTAKGRKTPWIVPFVASVVVATVIIAVLVSALVWIFPLWGPGGVGSGNLVTKEMSFSDFTAVEAGMGFTVVITQSSSYSVSITADENLFDSIQVSKSGETLNLGTKLGNYKWSTLRAEITMPDLYELQLSGGSHGTVKGFHSSHSFVLDLFQGSHIERAEGSANDLHIRAWGGSHLDMSNFQVHNADVELSGGSHITISLDGRLDAKLSGSSHLYYIGEPTLGNIQKSGGSKISKR